MSEVQTIANGAAHAAPEGQEKPFDFGDAFTELVSHVNLADAHLKTLLVLIEVAQKAKGEDRFSAISAGEFAVRELEHYAIEAAETMRGLYGASRREDRVNG